MNNYKSILDQFPVFNVISQVATAMGLETYVIGGFVRDLLLERPSKDIDIVCVGNGIQLAKAVARAIDKNTKGKPTQVNYFKNFGTAQLKFNDWEVEFVGARKESYNRQSRKPIVEDGTLVDDQKRRDFTINALAIGLNTSTYGDLVDPFGGIHDLKRRYEFRNM